MGRTKTSISLPAPIYNLWSISITSFAPSFQEIDVTLSIFHLRKLKSRGRQGTGPWEGGALREEKGKERGAGGNSEVKSLSPSEGQVGELTSLRSYLPEGGQGDEQVNKFLALIMSLGFGHLEGRR